MNETNFFLIQIKLTKGVFDKGVVVKGSFESAKQGYHSYLGAYAYGQNEETDFVFCAIADMTGTILKAETWRRSDQATNS